MWCIFHKKEVLINLLSIKSIFNAINIVCAVAVYVGLMRSGNRLYWHDNTDYDPALGVVISNNGFSRYCMWDNFNFNDLSGSVARGYLCQGNFDDVDW